MVLVRTYSANLVHAHRGVPNGECGLFLIVLALKESIMRWYLSFNV